MTKLLSGDWSSINFIDTEVGETSGSLPFTITNIGTEDVTITAFDTGTQFGSDFSGPVVLIPTGALLIYVYFAPVSAGLQNYAATPTSDATSYPTLDLSGTGTGVGLRDLTIRKLNGDGFISCELDDTGIQSKTNYMNGNIGEVLVYEGQLDEDDRGAITDFLKEKWGIS